LPMCLLDPFANNSFAEQQAKPLKKGDKASRKAARKALKAAKKRAGMACASITGAGC
jgi:hypothetical protein